jgi:hypothetical protein
VRGVVVRLRTPLSIKQDRDGISTPDDTQRSGWCTMDNEKLVELHRYSQFRTLSPLAMWISGLHLVFVCLGPQPITLGGAESDIRTILAISNVAAMVICGRIKCIVDDKQAHCANVWLNELNAAFTCALCIWCRKMHAGAGESQCSLWGMSQLCYFFFALGVLMHLLGYPAASRGEQSTQSPRTHPKPTTPSPREPPITPTPTNLTTSFVLACLAARVMCMFLVTALSHHEGVSDVGQPLETLTFTISMLCGELLGNYCDTALRDMFIAQATERARHEQRVEQLEGEKQRIEYDLLFSQRALANESAASIEKCVIRRVPSSMDLSERSERDGLPRMIPAGHIAEGLVQSDSGVADHTRSTESVDPAPGFQLEGERNLKPMSMKLSCCGSSTAGSCSEIASAFEADGEAHVAYEYALVKDRERSGEHPGAAAVAVARCTVPKSGRQTRT